MKTVQKKVAECDMTDEVMTDRIVAVRQTDMQET